MSVSARYNQIVLVIPLMRATSYEKKKYQLTTSLYLKPLANYFFHNACKEGGGRLQIFQAVRPCQATLKY